VRFLRRGGALPAARWGLARRSGSGDAAPALAAKDAIDALTARYDDLWHEVASVTLKEDIAAEHDRGVLKLALLAFTLR
jgi:hypothetical protein